MRARITAFTLFAFSLMGLAASGASAQVTLQSIKQRGTLICGSNVTIEGFGIVGPQGHWMGFDVDFCRAIAAAIFNDPTKVRFTSLDAKDRFTALQSGEVDVLSRNTTWTMSRDTQLGLDFPAITYFDGQGFMVRKALGISSAKDLNGKSICVEPSTTTELNLADYFRANNMKYEPMALIPDEVSRTYDADGCDALTADTSALYSHHFLTSHPDDHIVLPEIISKEPLGPAVRQDDPQWVDLVRWVHHAMLNAEEFGVTRENVEQMRTSDHPEVRRLLGTEGQFGDALGLTKDWVVRIIKHVGNYGEVFERNLGEGSRLKIKRGRNALWTKGGLQYGIPTR
jgi:general L-amino acid transport system substrate-binding protein